MGNLNVRFVSLRPLALLRETISKVDVSTLQS
jgi:hypothetical protein